MAPHLTKENRKRFNTILKKLREMFPTAYPVKIRTVSRIRSKQNYGLIQLINDKKNTHFLITLMRTEYGIMLDSLLHEWSHAINWKLIHNTNDSVEFHDESWAVEYSKLYRMFIDPGLENPNQKVEE